MLFVMFVDWEKEIFKLDQIIGIAVNNSNRTSF